MVLGMVENVVQKIQDVESLSLRRCRVSLAAARVWGMYLLLLLLLVCRLI